MQRVGQIPLSEITQLSDKVLTTTLKAILSAYLRVPTPFDVAKQRILPSFSRSPLMGTFCLGLILTIHNYQTFLQKKRTFFFQHNYYRNCTNMKNIYLTDAGDGLCLGLSDVFGNSIQIDWGSINGAGVAIKAWERMMSHQCFQPCMSPNIFILSHFHSDHFNGLMKAVSITSDKSSTKYETNIRQVFYPGRPKFPKSKEFYNALLAISFFTMGDNSGNQAADLTDMIRTLNGYQPRFKALFKGMEFSFGNFRVECLWPPEEYSAEDFPKIVETALRAFDSAMKENDLLRGIYEKVAQNNTFEGMNVANDKAYEHYERKHRYNWLNADIHIKELEKRDRDKTSSQINEDNEDLIHHSEVFRDANKKLKDAANSLCLVLMINKKILFWGDLEKREIGNVASTLVDDGYTDFDVMIAPHHGTHWHDEMMKLRTKYMLVPNGSNGSRNFVTNLNKISSRLMTTYTSGDIQLNAKEFE